MRYELIASLLLTSAASATIITNANCSVTLGLSPSLIDSGPTQCSVILTDPSGQFNLGRSIATSTAMVTPQSNPAAFFTVRIDQSVQANGGPSPFGLAQAVARASANVDLLLTSAGPPRRGVLSVSASSTAPPLLPIDDITGGTSFQVGPLIGTCVVAAIPCTGAGRIGIDLGVPFVLDITQTLRGANDASGDGAQWNHGTGLFVELLESDGKTPVGIQILPEPATWAMGAFGLAMLLAFRKSTSRR